MSHLLVCATEITDLMAVKRALQRMGLVEGADFQVSPENGLTHTAYNSAVTKGMALVIPKATHQGYGDFGVKRVDGNYSIYVDDLDNVRTLKTAVAKRGVDTGVGESRFTDRLLQWYGVICAEDTLRAEGMTPTTVQDADGRMRVTADY